MCLFRVPSLSFEFMSRKPLLLLDSCHERVLCEQRQKVRRQKVPGLTARISRSRLFSVTVVVGFCSDLSSRIFCHPLTSVSPRAHHCQVELCPCHNYRFRVPSPAFRTSRINRFLSQLSQRVGKSLLRKLIDRSEGTEDVKSCSQKCVGFYKCMSRISRS